MSEREIAETVTNMSVQVTTWPANEWAVTVDGAGQPDCNHDREVCLAPCAFFARGLGATVLVEWGDDDRLVYSMCAEE